MANWFVCENDVVHGPFLEEEVIRLVDNEHFSSDATIWGKPLDTWKPYTWWKSHLEAILANSLKPAELWHYALKGETFGPVDRSTLILKIRQLDGDANDILIWTQGMKSWAPIYEFHDLMDEADVNRRVFPRAPASGKIKISHGNKFIIGDLYSISEGGFGGRNFSDDLAPGMVVKIHLESDAFVGPAIVNAQIRFVDDNTVGFKFNQINREVQSQIISYVKDKNSVSFYKINKAS